MKFDFIIGNPPYQDENEKNTRKPPIYHLFMNGAYEVADKVELITPARFLFNAGQTPKEWNRRMLSDVHLKVLDYEPDAEKVFPNTDIKGGVAITYHDSFKYFGEIGIFTAWSELNSILTKVKIHLDKGSLKDITVGAVPYRFSERLKKDMPGIENDIGKSFDLRTNVLDNLEGKVFSADKPDDGRDYVQILGLKDKKRTFRWIRKDWVEVPDNFYKWKVFVPKANGTGSFGESLSSPIIGRKLLGHTQTFISIGGFETENEAKNLLKYIMTKFARALLGVLKTTQDNPRSTWGYIPLQDFTSSSDIDWSQSIADIDQQLYRKYGLDEKEIEFIETHVKEMK